MYDRGIIHEGDGSSVYAVVFWSKTKIAQNLNIFNVLLFIKDYRYAGDKGKDMFN